MNRTKKEFAEARAALDKLMASRDIEEALVNFERVPDWVFREDPNRSEWAAMLFPVCLAKLRDLAANGSEEAGTALMRLLEENPHLQAMFPPDEQD